MEWYWIVLIVFASWSLLHNGALVIVALSKQGELDKAGTFYIIILGLMFLVIFVFGIVLGILTAPFTFIKSIIEFDKFTRK